MRRRSLVGAAGAAGLGALACTLGGGSTGALAQASPGSSAPDDLILRRIAVGSCIDQTRPQPLWDAVLDSRPDLFVFAGDNVYASQPPWSLERLQQAYAQLAAQPGFARLRASVPHLAIWDDHDYGLNDGGAEFVDKQASKQAFLDFWRVPAQDARRQREGLYAAASFGPPGSRVQVLLPDTRWFRSPLKPTPQRNAPGAERYVPDADPSLTMLGEAQWRWLEERLREPADLRLIVSSIQVLAEGHGFERWGNFPLQRQRLFDLIARTRANGVVLLSGDRHIGALYRETRGTPYPLLEMTSSGMTHPWRQAAEAGPNRLGPLLGELHFGLVDVDWESRAVTLSLRDTAGAVQREVRVGLDELKAP